MIKLRKEPLKAIALGTAIGATGLAALCAFGHKIFPPAQLRRQEVPFTIKKDDWKFGGVNCFYDHNGDGKADEQLSVWNPSREMYDRLMRNPEAEPAITELDALDKASDIGRGWDHYVAEGVKPENQRWVTQRTNKNPGNFIAYK